MGNTYTVKVRLSPEANECFKGMALSVTARLQKNVHTAEVIEHVVSEYVKPRRDKIIEEVCKKFKD